MFAVLSIIGSAALVSPCVVSLPCVTQWNAEKFFTRIYKTHIAELSCGTRSALSLGLKPF